LDGRIKDPCLSTPGGDIGEFLLGLQTLSDILGENVELSQNVIKEILVKYLKQMK
jgi:hypothetical protein